jgi:hypothetical protein
LAKLAALRIDVFVLDGLVQRDTQNGSDVLYGAGAISCAEPAEWDDARTVY